MWIHTNNEISLKLNKDLEFLEEGVLKEVILDSDGKYVDFKKHIIETFSYNSLKTSGDT